MSFHSSKPFFEKTNEFFITDFSYDGSETRKYCSVFRVRLLDGSPTLSNPRRVGDLFRGLTCLAYSLNAPRKIRGTGCVIQGGVCRVPTFGTPRSEI